VTEIVHRVVESLQTALVAERNVPASKNLIRVLAVLVDYGVIASGAVSSLLLNLLDECQNGAGGKLRQPQDIDLVLEVILAALPIIAPRLQREQALDYGTLLETLRKLFTQRKISTILSPLKGSQDHLSLLWTSFSLESNPRNSYDKAYLHVG